MTPDRKIKVCIVSDAEKIWGAERSLLILLAELRLLADVTLVVQKASPLRREPGAQDLVSSAHILRSRRRVRLAGGTHQSSKMALLVDAVESIFGGLSLARYVRKFDIVVCFGTWELLEVLTAAKVSRRPCVLDLHETFSAGRGTDVLRLLCKHVSGVLVTSRGVENSLPASVRTELVARPINHSVYKIDEAVHRIKRSVAVVGQIAPHKQVLELLQSLERGAREQLVVYVVGGEAEVEQRSDYEQQVRVAAKNSIHRVLIIDKTDNVVKFMNLVEVIVNTSLHEAFGRSIIEGMAVGCYPIVRCGTGPAEIVQSSGIGSVFEDIDLDLPRLILEYFDEPISLRQDQRVGAILASQIYSQESIGANYLHALRSLADV